MGTWGERAGETGEQKNNMSSGKQVGAVQGPREGAWGRSRGADREHREAGVRGSKVSQGQVRNGVETVVTC